MEEDGGALMGEVCLIHVLYKLFSKGMVMERDVEVNRDEDWKENSRELTTEGRGIGTLSNPQFIRICLLLYFAMHLNLLNFNLKTFLSAE